jgi:hypothetical protein
MAGERLSLPTIMSPRSISQRVKFESFAEIEDFALDILRRTVLAQGQKELSIVLMERIEQWKTRGRRKSK